MAFPEAPHERRLILPLTEADLARCRADREGRKMLLDEAVAVVDLPLSDADGSNDLLGPLAARDQIRSRGVLVQSALDPETYYDLSEAADRLAQDKVLNTVLLCQMLGARSVNIDEASRVEGARRSDLKSAGKRSGTRVDLHRKASDIEQMVRKANLAHDFVGRQPDIDGAYRHLRTTGLDQDAHLKALVQLCEHENTLTKQHLSITTGRESEKVRRWVTKVRVPFTELKGEVDTVVKERVEYDFTFTVELGDRAG